MYRIAFIGFKHSHIFSLYEMAGNHPEVTIAAACEAHPVYRRLASEQGVWLTHDQPAELLADTSVDIIAIGDAYGMRGSHVIAALKAGKHVLSDKPLCTSMAELDEIRRLVQVNQLKVGMMLDLRFSPITGTVRDLLRHNRLGDVHAAFFSGQHPLLYGTRPDWYFEPQMHGGTINDIAIHGMDLMACLTGLRLEQVLAARCWNAYASAVPGFRDCAQFMVRLNNGSGLLADVSYASPDSMGYNLPSYWRFTLWCAGGVIEFSYGQPEIRLALNGETAPRLVPVPDRQPGNALQALLDDISGRQTSLETMSVLQASRETLAIQMFADQAIE